MRIATRVSVSSAFGPEYSTYSATRTTRVLALLVARMGGKAACYRRRALGGLRLLETTLEDRVQIWVHSHGANVGALC